MGFWKEGSPGGHGSRWRWRERFVVPAIDSPDEDYLRRYRILQTPWFSVFVHRIGTPDVRTFHDHPWDFFSLVLWRGYIEAVPEGEFYDYPPHATRFRKRRLGSVMWKRRTDLHYISELQFDRPAWTFVVTGPRRRKWGYVDEAGWTAFDEHPHNDAFVAAREARR